jgi:hypothetical protein
MWVNRRACLDFTQLLVSIGAIALRISSERCPNTGLGRLGMSTAQPPTPTSVYPDRSTRLMLLGIVQVLLGCLCGLLAVMMVALSSLGPMAGAPQGQAMHSQMMVPAMVFYLPLAVAFIWLGIGLACARRWAWTLTVLLSWMWLIMGVVGSVMVVFFMGPMMASVAQQGKMPPEALMVMLIFLGAVMGCVYLLLPGVFLALCHGESVRATCQRRDPKIRWTDRCPMPVLALSIMLVLSVVSMSSLVAYGCVMPLFGVLISGAAGAVVILLIALVLAYLAWGTYRLQMAAWWGTLLLGIVGALNAVVTFSRTDLMEMYEKMGMPADQLEMMRKTGLVESMSHWGPWMGLVGGAGALGYLLYVRRYFVRSAEGTSGIS